MLKKIDTVDEMKVCEENLICEKCPCHIYGRCLHPYAETNAKIGDVVIPSVFNTDPRVEDRKEYRILDVYSGLVKVEISENETEWYSSEDFILSDKGN